MSKTIKRKDLLPKVCSRCGDHLLNGQSIYYFPFEKQYMVLCAVCHRGLGFPRDNFIDKYLNETKLTEFWEEVINK